jgi:hypothetical protein
MGHQVVRSRALASLLAAILACPVAPARAQAGPPGDVSELVGARAAGGEEQLGSRGYVKHHAAKTDEASYVYWWHPSKKQCIRVKTEDGRYAQIAQVSNSDCDQPDAPSGPSTGAKVAIGAAALLGVAALLHKSHHRKDRDHDERQSADFERGYRDGMYNHPYHNYDNKREYSDGFSAGVDERRQQSSYRYGSEYRGGYQSHTSVADLDNKDRDYAIRQLERRGFDRVSERRRDGDRVQYHYWNRSTQQCATVVMRDDRVLSIRETDRGDCR